MTRLLFPRSSIAARSLLGLLLLLPGAALSQTDTNNAADISVSTGEAPMQAPPPVSNSPYSTDFASETASNYLRGGITVTGAYSNNVASTQVPTAGSSFSVWPTIAFDKTTVRSHTVLTYSPGVTIYPQTSALNQFNQNLSFTLQYRLSPNVTANLNEAFSRTSNVFNQPSPITTISVSGAAPPPPQAVIPPVADQRSNATNAQITYRCGENCMIGGGGGYNTVSFVNSNELSGLYNSDSATGSVFYSQRLRDRYFVGVSYLYQNTASFQSGTGTGANTHTQTQALSAFLTYFFRPNFSMSVLVGPQHFTSSQPPFQASQGWSPLTTISLSWQGSRTNLAASYSRIVSAAGGLNGAYNSYVANLAARWQASRNWGLGASASYLNYETVTPLFTLSTPGGRTITGTVSAHRPIGEHFSVQVGYNWIRQSYSGGAAATPYPDTSRIFISLSYHITRPIS